MYLHCCHCQFVDIYPTKIEYLSRIKWKKFKVVLSLYLGYILFWERVGRWSSCWWCHCRILVQLLKMCELIFETLPKDLVTILLPRNQACLLLPRTTMYGQESHYLSKVMVKQLLMDWYCCFLFLPFLNKHGFSTCDRPWHQPIIIPNCTNPTSIFIVYK